MFDNSVRAEKKAKEFVQDNMRHDPDRDRVERDLAGHLEKNYDDWVRKNVGLD